MITEAGYKCMIDVFMGLPGVVEVDVEQKHSWIPWLRLRLRVTDSIGKRQRLVELDMHEEAVAQGAAFEQWARMEFEQALGRRSAQAADGIKQLRQVSANEECARRSRRR